MIENKAVLCCFKTDEERYGAFFSNHCNHWSLQQTCKENAIWN